MTTQYSPILKLALPVQGELSGIWGDVVNDNITSMVEQAVAGRAVVNTWSANSHTLTTANGTSSESRCAMLELTDTGTALSGAGTVICPTASKIYIVKNGAGQNITVKTSAGTGILIPDGRTTFLFCDGTNVVEALTHTTSLQLGTSTVVTAVLDEDNMASDSATSLATQQSIKAYVDSQVGANNELSEVLANGNTTGGNDIVFSAGDNITNASGNLTIDVVGELIIDADLQGAGNGVILKDDGIAYGSFFRSSSNLHIKAEASDQDMLFMGNDNGSEITALTLDMSEAGAATFNNDVTAFSDERLKSNITTIPDALSKVSEMRGVHYVRNETGKDSSGVIAQELQKIAPELVLTADDEMGTLSVNYGNITGYLIEAIKELSARVKELEGK